LEITSQGFALVTTATTLGAGNIGDNISVRATRTNRILRAQVIDSSTVRAALGEGQQ
jgi:flagella basal body P-ring formation protein FlgA